MAGFVDHFDGLRPSSPFIEMDPGFELMSQFAELNGSIMESPSLGLMGFSNESYLSHEPREFSTPLASNLPGFLPAECSKPIALPQSAACFGEQSPGDRKRKAKLVPETSSANSSEPPSQGGLTADKSKKKNNSKSGKRGRSNSKEDEKPKEVVHVRARRGQATDSHSLAERVRREKINEKMRRLQDLVPGCYKAMGMAGMLDEIINYVQSLQNQVEFLSMKLSAATSLYEYSLDIEAMATPQITNAYEAQEVETLAREGYGGCTSFHSTIPF